MKTINYSGTGIKTARFVGWFIFIVSIIGAISCFFYGLYMEGEASQYSVYSDLAGGSVIVPYLLYAVISIISGMAALGLFLVLATIAETLLKNSPEEEFN
ncbi:MAG: hypothetical protein LBQ73_09275 [Tannerellaceae bacterium]|jgi:hypothetical protein|nr:hypothetical protein [Tannerellaceae bacterium]